MDNPTYRVTSKLVRIRENRPAPPQAKQPSGRRSAHPYQVSLILPTKDRCQGLIDVLQSVAPAMGDVSFEIILYADRDSGEIRDVVKRFGIKKVFFDNQVFESREAFSWPGLMNHGFAQCQGQWIMFGSDDIVFQPHCFGNALTAVAHPAHRPIGGISFLHRNTVETYDGFFEKYGYDTLNGDKIYINFGLISADAFERTSGFDENLEFFWADVDICLQLWDRGYDIVASHGSLVDHHNILETVKKDQRIDLFRSDTRTFHEKWSGKRLFGPKAPLEKIRFFFGDKQARRIKKVFQSQCPSLQSVHTKKRHLVIDGVIFQLQAGFQQGISRVWRNLIPELARELEHMKITVLQRGGFEIPVADIAIQVIGAYDMNGCASLERDEDLLGKTCKDLDADLFVSTYYTHAPGVPNVVLIHDLIPEILQYDLSQPEWLAKQRAVEMGDAFVTISETTLGDLIRHYPQIRQRPMRVAPIGLDNHFRPVDETEILSMRRKMGLDKPYFLLVGRRYGYKNGVRLMRSLARLPNAREFTLLCVGGETELSEAEKALAGRLDLRFTGRIGDKALNGLYCGAHALLVPSQYEGFGLPVLEAMACGCPVVAHASDAVKEIAGDAVIYADTASPKDLERALTRTGDPAVRRRQTAMGLRRAARFDWQSCARKFAGLMNELNHRPSILLTALVSTYNAAEFIYGCLDDLESQTMAEQMEIVVVDSASQQDEVAVVRDFQRRNGNIKYLRTRQRENVYRAWNRGIKFALGKYVTTANTDDRHRRDALAQMVQVLDNHPEVALVYADVIRTETANESFERCTPTGMFRWHDWQRRTLLEKGCFMGPQPVWRRQVHDEYGYFDERYETSGDFEFWLRISQTHEFHHIARPLGLYMDRPDSIEHSNDQRKRREDSDIIETYRQAAAQGRIIHRRPATGTDTAASRSDAVKSHERSAPGPDTPNCRRPGADGFTQGGEMINSPETILNAIDCLFQNGHGEAADWAVEKMQMDYPDAPELYDHLAARAYELGDMRRALSCYEKAAAMAPQQADAQKNLGDFYYAVQKDAEMALAQYVKVLEIEPDHIDTLILAGHISISQHRYAEAQQYYRKVQALEPGNTMVREFLEKLGQGEGAGQTAEDLMTADEGYAAALDQIRKGNRSEALAMLEQVIDQDPGHAPAHNDLGVLHYEAGDMERARRHYEIAAELAPEGETFQKNLGDFYWVELGDPQKAMEQYLRVLKLAPQDIDTLLSCGQICLSIKKPDDARDFFDTVLTLEPWNEDARQLQHQLEADMPGQAPGMSGDDLYGQAQAMASSGDLAGAIDQLKQLLTQSPGLARAHNDLGVLYYETGDMDQAEASYERAVQLDPKATHYRKNLADFYLFERGRAEEAMRIYLKILEEDSEDVEALNAVGVVCVTLGKLDDAQHFYHRVLEIEPWNETAQNALNQMRTTSPAHSEQAATNAAAG